MRPIINPIRLEKVHCRLLNIDVVPRIPTLQRLRGNDGKPSKAIAVNECPASKEFS